MAQITEVRLVDDLDKSEASETVEFGIDGKLYQIDLNETHAQALRENLAEYVDAARKVAKDALISSLSPARGKRSGNTGGSAADKRVQNTAIREWARQNGHTVSDRGRIPASVVQQFEAAHGSAA
jgi:hypothetical protein